MNREGSDMILSKAAFLSLGCFLLFAASAYSAQPEELLGVSLNSEKKEITIDVASSGCTRKEDFRFEMRDNTLTVLRLQRDACKAAHTKLRLAYSLKEAGIDPHKPFRIANSFVVSEFSANLKRQPAGK